MMKQEKLLPGKGKIEKKKQAKMYSRKIEKCKGHFFPCAYIEPPVNFSFANKSK